MRILVLQGPNLNLLGTREPEKYGSQTLAELSEGLDALGAELGLSLTHFQSNHEGDLVDKVQGAAREGFDGALINAGAYTHTSIALRDALLGTGLPFYEVHLTDIKRRETFRHHSFLCDIAIGVIMGQGAAGYAVALRRLVGFLQQG